MGWLVLCLCLSIITRTKEVNLTYGPSVASLDMAVDATFGHFAQAVAVNNKAVVMLWAAGGNNPSLTQPQLLFLFRIITGGHQWSKASRILNIYAVPGQRRNKNSCTVSVTRIRGRTIQTRVVVQLPRGPEGSSASWSTASLRLNHLLEKRERKNVEHFCLFFF